jgi:hypothetical protein
MCLSCGCGIYDDPMGSDKTITTKSFAEAAKAMDQTPEEAMEETYKALKKILNKKPDQE